MGIQINGNTDIISATDGSLSIQGASGNITGDVIGNLTGNVTGDVIGNLTGNVTGNVNATGVSTFSNIRVTGGTISGVSTAGITTAYISTLSGISTIDASSAVSINQNLVFASGKGIDFSATANSSGTMTSELLSDYEEGTWTPTYTAGVNSPSYTNTSGTYTKIGRLVTFCLRIQLNSGTGNASQLTIGSLPFFEMGGPTGGAVISYNGGLRTDGNITCHVGTGTNVISFFQYDGTTFNGNEANNILGTLHINGFYFT